MATATTRTAGIMGEVPTQGVVFHDVTWNDYEDMLRLVGERPIRVTYDRGTMEVFMPSLGHEGDSYLLGRMVDTLTEEFEIPVEGGGTTTHKREDLDKGAEPDQCYWLREKAELIRGKRELNLTVDPAPDLVIEVDVTRGSLDRLKVFSALGVPEVWRSDARTLQFFHRQNRGAYRARRYSRNFPTVPVDLVSRFLERGRASDKTGWIRSFRNYIRENLLPKP
jgi:Uma2 family endonuclease